MIVASDGIWEFISSQQACDIVAEHGHATKACEALVKLAEKRWQEEEGSYRDDITCIVVMLPFLETRAGDLPEGGGGGGGAARAPSDINFATKSDAIGETPTANPTGGGVGADGEADAESFAKRRLSVATPIDMSGEDWSA